MNPSEIDSFHQHFDLVLFQIEDIDLQPLQRDLDEEDLANKQNTDLPFIIEENFELSCKSVKRINRIDSAS